MIHLAAPELSDNVNSAHSGRKPANQLNPAPPTGAVAVGPLAGCGGGSGVRASFATAFRNWRLKSGIPLKKVAKDLGLSVATISSWELGLRFPTGCNFELLVNYTGLPPCRLFCVMADKCVPTECLLALRQSPQSP